MQKIMNDISAVIGLPDTLELVSHWGGRELYVPEKMNRLHPIALTIGFRAAQKLSDAFPGVTLRLPIERNAVIDIRNRLIAEEDVAGSSIGRLSVRWGMTPQGIKAVLAKMRKRNDLGEAEKAEITENPRRDGQPETDRADDK